MQRSFITVGALLLTILVGCGTPPKPTQPAPTPAPPPMPPSSPPPAQTPSSITPPEGAPPAELQTFAFADPENGWIALDDQILATSDGGATWTDRGHVGARVTTMQLLSPTMGWVGTERGLYIPNGDGWEQIDTGIFQDLDFVDAAHGWARMNHSFWQTTDGGHTWSRLESPCSGGVALSYTSRTNGWILCGDQPGAGLQPKELHRTTDGGQTWQLVATSGTYGAWGGALAPGGYVSNLFFLDDQHGWISLARGTLIATADGGESWQGVPGLQADLDRPTALQFFSPARGFALNRRAMQTTLQSTEDGGATWQQLYPELSFIQTEPSTNAGLRLFLTSRKRVNTMSM